VGRRLGQDEIVRFLMTNLNEEQAAKPRSVALPKDINAKDA
jgi:hypothetical protein